MIMKTLILVLVCGLAVSACGSGTDGDVGDVTTITAEATTTTGAIDPGVYEVSLSVDFHEYTRIPGHGGIPTDYRLTYTLQAEFTVDETGGSLEVYPADGVVEWTRNCYTTMVGPEAELLSTHEGTNQLEIPTSIGDVPFDFGIEFADAGWLDAPSVALSPLSDAVAVLHRLPSVVDLASDIQCASLGPSVVIPNAGAAWMTADMVSFSGETMSRADLLNLEAGSGDPLYVVGEGAESGWVIGLVSQQQLASQSVPLSFTRQEADELGGWELTIEGEIRLVG
jgi:hypothetical protein